MSQGPHTADDQRKTLIGHNHGLRGMAVHSGPSRSQRRKGGIDTPKASEASPMAAYLFMLNSMMDRFQVNCSNLAPDGIRP